MTNKDWYIYKRVEALSAIELSRVLATSMSIAQYFSDEGPKISPRKIAVVACDIAAAMRQELVERGWVEECERPPSK